MIPAAAIRTGFGAVYLALTALFPSIRSTGEGAPGLDLIAEARIEASVVDAPTLGATARCVYEGDSISQGYPSWPDVLPLLYEELAQGTQFNLASNGHTTQQVLDGYELEIKPHAPIEGEDECFLFVMAGANDVKGGVTAEVAYANLKALWALARADGFTVVASTITPQSSAWLDTPQEQQAWADLNSYILSDDTLYDAVARSDLALPDPDDYSQYLDGLHPTYQGQIELAYAFGAAIAPGLDPSIVLESGEPTQIYLDEGREVVLRGQGFPSSCQLIVNGQFADSLQYGVQRVSAEEIRFSIPADYFGTSFFIVSVTGADDQLNLVGSDGLWLHIFATRGTAEATALQSFSWGSAISAAGDVDADGFDDVILGDPLHEGRGRAVVISGQTGTQLYEFTGQHPSCSCGAAVAAAGDVNGDGFDDLLVGCPDHSTDPVLPDRTGRAMVFSGENGALLYSFGTGDFDPESRVGAALSAAGDVDGDGFDDLIVGAPGDDSQGIDSGKATIFSGRTGSALESLTGQAAGDLLGHQVSAAGDVDADGFDDVLIAAAFDTDFDSGSRDGSVRVFSVKKGLTLYHLRGDSSADDRFGAAISAAGDLNHDGFDDIVVGDPLGSTQTDPVTRRIVSGYARVYSGADGTVLHEFAPQWPGPAQSLQHFGQSVSGVGDVDGDGFDDIIVSGTYGEDRDPDDGDLFPDHHSSRFVLYSGQTGAMLWSCLGEDWRSDHDPSLPMPVSGVGDFDGDGFDDVIVKGFAPPQVYSLGFTGTPPRMRDFGAGCPGSNDHLPRIDHGGRLAIGEPFKIRLRGALPNTTCVLLLAGATDQDLGAIFPGFSGCRQYAGADYLWGWAATDHQGMAVIGFSVPDHASLIGLPLSAQWGCLDDDANPFGATTSNALDLVFGD